MSDAQMKKLNLTIAVLKRYRYQILSKFAIASMIANDEYFDINTLEALGCIIRVNGQLV